MTSTLTPRLPAHLKADCTACVGLCCVVPPFDAVQGFGFDKPAETPCQHLCADHRCGIHDALVPRGFEGCAAFDCLGAGQRLTAQAKQRWGSADWRDEPAVARWLFAAYPRVRQAQAWLAQLRMAAQVSAQVSAQAPLQALADALEAEAQRWADWSPDEQVDWQARVQAALAPLAENRGSRT